MQRLGLFLFLFYLRQTAAQGVSSTFGDSCQHFAVDPKYLDIYNGTCFYFVTRFRASYPRAAKYCRTLGGTLAMPKTKDINTFIQRKLYRELRYSTPFWIGLHDRDTEEKYFWEDGSELGWNYFDYFTGGFAGGGEDCLAIEPSSGRWHDYRCQEFKFWSWTQDARKPFICQFLPDTKVKVIFSEGVGEKEKDVSIPGEDTTEGDSKNNDGDHDDETGHGVDATSNETQNVPENSNGYDAADENDSEKDAGDHGDSKKDAGDHGDSKKDAGDHGDSKKDAGDHGDSKKDAGDHGDSKKDAGDHGDSKKDSGDHGDSKKDAGDHGDSKKDAGAHVDSKKDAGDHGDSKKDAGAHGDSEKDGTDEDDSEKDAGDHGDSEKGDDDVETGADIAYDASQDKYADDNDNDITNLGGDTHVDKVDDGTDICGPFVCDDDCFYYGGYAPLPNGCPDCKCVNE